MSTGTVEMISELRDIVVSSVERLRTCMFWQYRMQICGNQLRLELQCSVLLR